MNKEQLKKILEPVKQVCLLYDDCNDCPLANEDHRCSITSFLIYGVSHEPVISVSKPYIDMLEKCIHNFCGIDSCRLCPKYCALKRIPQGWDLDELP